MADKSTNAAISIIPIDKLQGMIYTVRGMQVMLDSDLAEIYEVETKSFNRSVKRNIERFPVTFSFQLTQEEFENLRCQLGTSSAGEPLRCQIGTLNTEPTPPLGSQNATLDKKNLKSQNTTSSHGGRRYLPYVFTEQGVSMLSAILRSETAIKVSIQIINAFVETRHFMQNNASIFARLDSVEKRQLAFQIKAEENFDRVSNTLESAEPPSKGIFYNGQVHDAHSFVSSLIRKANKSVILIWGEIYHIGASLKDVGKKWFAFSKFETGALEMLQKLGGAK
jgi:phage regulator Rha-like protein